ncbi:MAG: spore germination protein [Bacillota bacterium]|nr:spore germination protein [Bacillota bacterium]MDK2856058.1 spore germination protein [Bacillota bacterium]MDK2925080.1 spore germination protein [Bacillota bacterium]
MSKKNRQVTAYQATAIIANAIIGVALLTLPRDLARTAGTGGYMAVVLMGLTAYLGLNLYTVLGRRFSQSTLPEYGVKSLGVFFGGLLALTYAAGWLVVTALSARVFAEIVVTAVLPRVPIEVGLMVMLLLAAHLATQDVKTFARVNELFLPIIVGTFVVLLALSFSRVEVWRLLPPFGPGLREVFTGTIEATWAYPGFELVSLFIPFYAEPEKAGRAHARALFLVIFLYVAVVLAATGAFGVAELAKSQWPTLELVRLVGFLGTFERLEAPFLAVYVITVFTTSGATFFGAVFTLSGLFRLKSREGWPYLLVIPLYYLAIQPQNIVELGKVIRVFAPAWFGFILLAPLLVLGIAAIRKKEDKPDEANQTGA